jgi:DNA-directed RNA polymerase sigma subunit (sigma70/sigma32)
MTTIVTMMITWTATATISCGLNVTAFSNRHSSMPTRTLQRRKMNHHFPIQNHFRWLSSSSTFSTTSATSSISSSIQRHMSSLADPQTKRNKTRSSSDHQQAVITMTRSQVDSFITRRDMERLEASFGLDSDGVLQLSETLKILSPTVETKIKTRPLKSSKVMLQKKDATRSNTTSSNSTYTTTTSSSSKNTKNKPSSSRRLSTMPGFRSRQQTKRHQSFRDGLKIAQTSNIHNAKKIAYAVNNKSAQLKRKKFNSEAMYLSSSSVPDSMIAFTNEIHKESRITPKEEADLGTKTQIAMKLQKVHSELTDRLGREPTDDEWCAATGKINMTVLQQAIQEGMEAKDKLVLANLRMVQGVVNLYIRNGLGSQYNAGDLMQEGTMVSHFDSYVSLHYMEMHAKLTQSLLPTFIINRHS